MTWVRKWRGGGLEILVGLRYLPKCAKNPSLVSVAIATTSLFVTFGYLALYLPRKEEASTITCPKRKFSLTKPLMLANRKQLWK